MALNIKDFDKPYMIAEIGINHNGDLQIAKKLIDATFGCGWHCAKFQKRTPDICVPEAQKSIMRETPWGKMTYLEYRKKVEFGNKEYDYIDAYCKEKPLDWTASVWDIPSLDFILQYKVPFIKIPSAMVTNIELLTEAAKSNKTIIISTGMSTIEEIDQAIKIVEKYGSEPVIMHTNSSYPAPVDELNLRIIPFLKKRYGYTVGYSGHEYGLEPSVIAVVLGARLIERHITLSHDMWGTDHKSSLEVHAMDLLGKRIKDIHVILGSDKKEVTKSEIPIRNKLRKI